MNCIGSRTDIFFVHIGAHSGQLRDPLYAYIILRKWAGLLIEPQPVPFRELKASYEKNTDLIFENVAVSDINGVKPFYYIEPSPNLPEWISQLSSFHKSVPEQIKQQYPEASIVSKPVECVTLSSLVAKHNISKVDIMVIDTEGHDFEILKSIDFEKIIPKLILFEHCHLSKSDYELAIKLLNREGYEMFGSHFNTIAFKDHHLGRKYEKFLVNTDN